MGYWMKNIWIFCTIFTIVVLSPLKLFQNLKFIETKLCFLFPLKKKHKHLQSPGATCWWKLITDSDEGVLTFWRGCYGLNACVPPKSLYWSLNPRRDGILNGAFVSWLDLDEVMEMRPMMGFMFFKSEENRWLHSQKTLKVTGQNFLERTFTCESNYQKLWSWTSH